MTKNNDDSLREVHKIKVNSELTKFVHRTT